jgi:hypothetical protein
MPRFVILLHETPAGYVRATHFDLMLQHAGSLRTWALDAMPAIGKTATAERLPDHRLAYLDFEGPIAGGRGTVRRVAAGEYETAEERAGCLVVQVRGAKLQGTLTLEEVAGSNQRWRVSLAAG